MLSLYLAILTHIILINLPPYDVFYEVGWYRILEKDFKERYGVISGLSDHTMGSTAPIVATCFGAKIIEKHFILDREMGGVDSTFSMNEEEFTNMVKAVREAEKSIGVIDYSLTEKQIQGKEFCRSLYVVEDITEGEVFTTSNIRSIRPGNGLHPKYYKAILGKKATLTMTKGDALKPNCISSFEE